MSKAAMPRKRPPAEDSAGGPSKEGTAEESIPSKKKALDSKFGGMTEEQVMELLLPDHLAQGLDIIFVREAAGGLGRCIRAWRATAHIAFCGRSASTQVFTLPTLAITIATGATTSVSSLSHPAAPPSLLLLARVSHLTPSTGPCLYQSGLIPKPMTAKDDAACLAHGIGFTNIVPRTTRSSNDLTRCKQGTVCDADACDVLAYISPLLPQAGGEGVV